MECASRLAGTLIEIFSNETTAQAAVRELREVGFRDSQITLVSPGDCHLEHQSQPFMAAKTSEPFGRVDQSENGTTVVTVNAGTRSDIASCVLNRFTTQETCEEQFVANY